MRILFLTPIFPVPVNNGIRHRMALTLNILAEAGEVTVITFATKFDSRHLRTGVLQSCREVRVVPNPVPPVRESGSPRSWTERATGLKNHLLNPRPVCTRQLDALCWHNALQAARPETYDLVWVQSLGLYGQILRYDLSNVVVDLPDAESIKARRELRGRLWSPSGALAALDWLKLRRAERTWGGGRHWFVVCSENDRRRISRARNVWVVRNGVELPVLQGVSPEKNTLVFIGSLGYKPNRDAAIYFSQKILPLIKRTSDAVRFYIVGGDPTPEIQALARDPQIVVTGSVQNVEPYLRRASVVVVPLLNGAGTRLKILEAMSYAKPIVSTSIGAEGLSVEHGRHLLLADTAQEFASRCVQLLRDDALQSRLGQTGREFVQARYRMDQAQDDLWQFLGTSFAIKRREAAVVCQPGAVVQ